MRSTDNQGTAPRVRLKEVTAYMRMMRSRMPFRFGTTVMTGMPVLHLKVVMESDKGETFQGWSACGLVSMWFDKDYSKPEAQREADLLYSVGLAVDGYMAAGAGKAFELHSIVEPGVRQKLQQGGLNGLTAGYGIALVDSAIIDGICRKFRTSFLDGLKQGLFGFDPALEEYLPEAPAAKMSLRHTIGLGDPLLTAEITEPIADGLPQSLEQVCETYSAKFFKIKVNNNVQESLDRLERISSILLNKAPGYKATLDGNEAFPDMSQFHKFVKTCAENKRLRDLWDSVLWIEQPVARQLALEPSAAGALKQVSRLKPVIIDESDDDDSALERALNLGYSGISAKNCKGVFRTLHSYLYSKRAGGGSNWILSSEDLTNQPILPNHQDLCVAAALGIIHSERNGHHFFRGFEFLSPKERQQAIENYPSLYASGPDGVPSLRIVNGEMDMTEINSSHGLGVNIEPDWESMEAVTLPKQPVVIT